MARDRNMSDPATRAFAITPHDTNKLAAITRGIYVGGAGNLAVEMADTPGTVTTFSAVPAGTLLPIQVIRVRTASTATLMLALY